MPVETCQTCMGTGLVDNVICNTCWGTGVLPLRGVAYQNSKLAELVQGIAMKLPSAVKLIYTYQIVEATNVNEYVALSEGQKSIYGLITSLGTIDFSEGTQIREKLLTMFPEGTTTRVNLLTL